MRLLAGVVLALAMPASAAAWTTSGASVYNGCPGAWGNVCGGAGFAELGGSGGVLMGGLKPGTRILIRYRGRTISAVKADWGSGGGAVGGYPRAIDLPCSTAARLGIYDCETWTGIVSWKLLVRVKRMRSWHVRTHRQNPPGQKKWAAPR